MWRQWLRLMEGEGGEGQSNGGGGGSGGSATIFGAAGSGQGSGQGSGSGGGGGSGGQGSQQQQGSGFSWGGIVGDDGNFKADWTNSLPEELKGAADTLKNYKTPVELMRGLHSTKQLLGQKGNTYAVPDDKSAPEVVTAFRKAVGAPDKWEGYGLKKPADAPAGVVWGDAQEKAFSEVFHKYHIPVAAAKELFNMEMQAARQSQEAFEIQEKQFVAEGVQSLKEKWGPNFDGNLQKAGAMAEKFGIAPDHAAFRHPEVVAAMFEAYRLISSEDGRMEGNSIIQQGSDPGAEADRIQSDKNHSMYQRYQDGEKTTVEHVRGLREKALKQKQ